LVNTPELPSRERGEDFYRSFLVGYGALFFAPHPVSGALFLLATFAASPVLGTAVLLGLFAATTCAHMMRRSRLELESGLYGFNGALAAFVAFSMQGDAVQLQLISAGLAGLTVPVTARLLDGAWTRRLGLPILSVPSLLVGLPFCLLARSLEWHPYATTILPPYLTLASLFSPELFSDSMRDAVASFPGGSLVLLLFMAGFALHSRQLLGFLAAGLALGSAVGFAFLGWVGAFDFSFVVVTALPTFLALAATFTGSGWRSVLFGAVGVLVSFALWFFGGLWLTDNSLPILTMPFVLSTLGGLLALRVLPLESISWLPRALPLHQVSSPDSAERWNAERQGGWRYWKETAGRLNQDWRDYSDEESITRARELVRKSQRIVFLTGAGISTESGIPDYRTGAVAWKQYDTEQFRFKNFMASEDSRRAYWQMSQDFFLVLRAALPNAGHDAIASLDALGKIEAVITQNVDSLHQRAGVASERVIEIHGSEHTVSCLLCGHSYDREEIYRWILHGVEVPYCSRCQGILKPNSVAFGQPMIEAECERALQAMQRADLLIIAGTSLEVQPVASLPLVALRAGVPVLVVNFQATDYDAFAELVFQGACGALLPELFRLNSSSKASPKA
jgi:NAD-dependent deacetylase